MSNLTDLFPAGAGGKQVDFVASGTIGNGVTVGLNSDGTVTAISGTETTFGDPVEYTSNRAQYNTSTFDSNSNKVVIAYEDLNNSQYATAVVGNVSGTSITFGTPVVIESVNSQYHSAAFDSSSNKVMVAYGDATGGVGPTSYGRACVGIVSGTSISFGTPETFNAYYVAYVSIDFDTNGGRFLITYRDSGNSSYGTARSANILSGTNINFGSSSYVFLSGTIASNSTTYDSNADKYVISYEDQSNPTIQGASIVVTMNVGTPSFGTPIVFNTGTMDFIASTFDSNSNKVVITFCDQANSDNGAAIVGTVSGTSISFGEKVIFDNEGDIEHTAITFDSNVNRVVITYEDNRDGDMGKFVVGEVRGSSLTFTKPKIFAPSDTVFHTVTFDSNSNKVVASYELNNTAGGSVVLDIGATNNYDFIGISDAAISDTATGTVTIKGGISTNVTALTSGAIYYVQDDGSLSTTVSDVLAGKTLSSTSINLDYTT